ncbi:Putative cytochrome P450 [Septoria linicola]|uniref:Cytochrome P450 n=1 Tax=Septoria linicola TaxID=215465 RepID=A0A9Q9ASN7_9PEZI|nr:Putative cytochrome P450 [Septoria linicola]
MPFDFPLIPTLALLSLLSLTLYKFLLHPLFLSPLSRIPNAHWSAPLSSLWILHHRLFQRDTPTIQSLHSILGPIIRLAPNEISVNCVNGGLRTIYAGGFEKGNWYSNVFSNYGVQPMFAMEGHREHAGRKRMLSHVYAKSTVLGSTALERQTEVIVHERLRRRLREECHGKENGAVVEFYDLFCAVTMDFVSGYVFGMKNGTDYVWAQREDGIKLFHDFKARQKYTFWPQECPGSTRLLGKLGLKWLLVPEWVDGANQDLEAWLLRMCEKARETRKVMDKGGKVEEEDVPSVYCQLEAALVKEKMRDNGSKKTKEEHADDLKIEIASELLDHTLAGFDTSSITLTWLAWELSKPHNLHWQTLLQEEITSTLGDDLDAKAIDNLPTLHAILMETLRLHAAIPGQQPRSTPFNTSTTLGDPDTGTVYHNIPPNTRVQSQAWSLHRNPTVFPEPNNWLPDRWLQKTTPSSTSSSPTSKVQYTARTADQLRDQTRHFWAFGSGGRMCVGSNLAMLDMKATVVGVWGKFSTMIEDDEGMVPNGG